MSTDAQPLPRRPGWRLRWLLLAAATGIVVDFGGRPRRQAELCCSA